MEENITFQLVFENQVLQVKEHALSPRIVFVIKFPDESLLKITKADIPGGKTIWVSIGEEKHKLAGEIGKLIEANTKNNKS